MIRRHIASVTARLAPRGAMLAAGFLAAAPALAESADYGRIMLNGLARDTSWPLNPPGEAYAMVCNVDGPFGYLSIRSGPGPEHEAERRLKRLATVTVDTGQRQGSWVRVLDAHRTFTESGKRQDYTALTVQGWAHDGHLCDFIDY